MFLPIPTRHTGLNPAQIELELCRPLECYRGHSWPTVQTRRPRADYSHTDFSSQGRSAHPSHPFTVQGSTVKAKVMTDISEQLLTRKQISLRPKPIPPMTISHYHWKPQNSSCFIGNYLNSYPSCKDLLMIIFCSTPFCPKITG